MAKQLLEPPIGHEIVIWNFCFSLTPSRRCSRIRRQRRIGTTRRSTATRPTIPFGRPMGRPRFTPTTTRSMRPSRIFFFNFDKKSFDIHHSHVVSVYRTKRFMLDVAGVVVILSLPPLPFIMRFFWKRRCIFINSRIAMTPIPLFRLSYILRTVWNFAVASKSGFLQVSS